MPQDSLFATKSIAQLQAEGTEESEHSLKRALGRWSELKKASREADTIFLAPDPDREGEAIAWHIASEIADPKSQNGKIYRIIFNEITQRPVQEAIKNPGRIDMNKVDAQQARGYLTGL